MDYPFIKNFANSAYREARVLADRLGQKSTAKQVITDGAGNRSLLEMLGGMPRVTPLLRPGPIAAPTCPAGLGPITEGLYADRENYGGNDFAREDVIYSYDGLYSIGREPLKAMSITLGTNPTKVWMTFSNPATPATDTLPGRSEVKATRKTACDLVEISRTMRDVEQNWVVVKNSRQLALFSHQEIGTIDFERPRESVPTVTRLRFNTPLTSYNGSMVPKEIGGIHNNIETTYTAGLVTKLRQSRQYATIPQSGYELTNGVLDIILSSPGQALEAWSAEALATVGNQSWLALPTPPVFPVSAEFGALFKCFHTAAGLYTDEYRLNKITAPLVVGVTSGTLPTFNPAEAYKLYPRYFNFTDNDFTDPMREGKRPDFPVPGTKCVLKGDVQYQFSGGILTGGYSAAPGMAIDLKLYQHLYKDPAGRVWLINFEWQHTVTHAQIVRVTVYRRFDPIFEPSKTPILSKVLIEEEIPFEYTRPTLPGSYRPLGSATWRTMDVRSLPNGTEACGMCVISSPTRLTRVGLSALFETSVLTGCIVVEFSGTGTEDGSGITAKMRVIPVWREDSSDSVPTVSTGSGDVRSSVVTGIDPAPVVTTETVSISSSGRHDGSSFARMVMLLGLSPTVDNEWEEAYLVSEQTAVDNGQTVQTGSGETVYTTYHNGTPAPTLTGNFNYTSETNYYQEWKQVFTLVHGKEQVVFEYKATAEMTSGAGRSVTASGVNDWNGTATTHVDVTYEFHVGDFVGATQYITGATSAPIVASASSGYSYSDTRINLPPSPILFNPVDGQSATFPARLFRYANPVLDHGGLECGVIVDTIFSPAYQSVSKLYAGAVFPRDQDPSCLCHDPRNARVWVAPDPSAAGAFY